MKSKNVETKKIELLIVFSSLAVILLFVAYLGSKSCPSNSYSIEVYDQESMNLQHDLYIITKELPEECKAYMHSFGIGAETLGSPMPVFTYEGSGTESKSGSIYLIPVIGNHAIQGFYILSSDKLSIGYTTSLSGKIQSIAEKTSAEMPLYLVSDSVYTYAVIGNTAYYIGDPIMEKEEGYLPKIVLGKDDKIEIAVISGFIKEVVK